MTDTIVRHSQGVTGDQFWLVDILNALILQNTESLEKAELLGNSFTEEHLLFDPIHVFVCVKINLF